MDDCVNNTLAEARDDMTGGSVTPTAEHIFNVNDDNPEPPNGEDSDCFHSMLAKLLFLSKRARPDVQQAIAFPSTRVKSPNTDNHKKLAQVIGHLQNDPHLLLTLEVDNVMVVKWWINASCAVHNDMRSHTGATMSMGKGLVISTSIKQKCTTL